MKQISNKEYERCHLYQTNTIQERTYQIEQMTPDANRYRLLRKFLCPHSMDEILR